MARTQLLSSGPAYSCVVDSRPEQGSPREGAVPRFHSNAMRTHAGPFDITLDFRHRVGTSDPAEPLVQVTMSWEHALAMVRALQGVIDSYEASIGKLPEPEVFQAEEE
jgi:hypothetical protein